MIENQTKFYINQIEKYSVLLETARKKHRLFSMARLFVFIGMLVSGYCLSWNWIMILVLGVELAVFVYFVNKWLDTKREKEICEHFITLNNSEIKLLNGDWSDFPDGTIYKSGQHPFSADMDLFGAKSVFQYLNRTVLPLGSMRLAETLSCGAKDKNQNKALIHELSENIEWCQKFHVESKVFLKNEDKQKDLKSLKEVDFGSKNILVLRWVLPVISLVSILLYNLDLITSSLLILIALVVLAFIGFRLKQSNKWMHLLSNSSEKIEVLNKQLLLFKELELKSDEAKKYQEQLFGKMGVQQGLNELLSIKKKTDYRMNVLVGLLLNFLFSWDFFILNQSIKWQQKYAKELELWELYLAEIEVWISGAIYKFNRANVCFAEENKEQFEIIGLGHPFVSVNKQVTNDFELLDDSFLIITGPNMAGKSTFLRSVGLAIISANAGFPVLATKCVLPKIKLYTSMRTSDDLTVESSYFHAELTRLRFIMDAIESGEKTFVILDEILKGTNSRDKEIGSAGFLQKLNKLGAKGLIATHDLSLTNLAHQENGYQNVCFDSTILEDDLEFDYKIRKGVCQNMNASFLLKKMRLVDLSI